MATVLLLIIYIAFIGLGIPDSVFGTAWPAIYKDFGAPVFMGSIVSALVSGGTILCSFFSTRLIKKFGTAKVSLISTAITAAALIGFRFSANIWWMFLCAFPLGIGAGAIDTALNNYVALHYKAVHMNFLHCFYGIGVTVGPFILSFVLVGKSGWRGGYEFVSYIQLTIVFILLISMPLWKKVKQKESAPEEEQEIIPFTSLIRQRKVRLACLLFLCSCGIEVTCGTWGSTFLVEAKGLEVDTAAVFMTVYYAGIAFGRFLSGIFSKLLTPWRTVVIGQIFVGGALIMLLLPLPGIVSGIFLFFIGCGIGPMFPNLLYNTPICFGQKAASSVIGIQMTASYIGILGSPLVFGLLAQYVWEGLFPIYLTIIFIGLITSTVLFQKEQKKALSVN